ncbi:MAG TPA: DUF2249 domain-containing protein [Burkholderiales bacterium]|nr:DUF2249 domain-containing protein [Burkholderiales bacterium]
MQPPKVLDCRGLEPPEPLECVLEAISRLGADEQVLMLIDREPRPLYRILRENRYDFRTELNERGWFEVLIWRSP